jgi:DNA invertase Pin-like site-specific DNA recombinase
MSGPTAISRSHLDRLAVIYVRQSTPAQVRYHQESTTRQYGLADEAVRLGWEASKILVIDADLGHSGRSGSARTGFQELVSRVCLGEVGAIFGLEVSRLARSSADLQRLLEFCSLTDTLIIDADGIYDLQQFNDRLLLGLKDVMSVAELHILAGRLQESIRAAARRGELRLPLPIGYVYDDEGHTVLDPHEEVRAAVADVFATFTASGSACGVVRAFAGRPFPCLRYGRDSVGAELRWGRLRYARVIAILSNPTYTGAYVFGRFHSRRMVTPDGTIRTKRVERPRTEWLVYIPAHHPAYISEETFMANAQRLAANYTHGGARPSREGSALLQGIVLCGGCGRPMATIYNFRTPRYACQSSYPDHLPRQRCGSIVAPVVDRAVAARVLQAVAPDQLALALAAAEEVADRRARGIRALELRVERARYDVSRAERAFHRCEPENRLVARSLEQRWEEKLRELAAAEESLRAAQTNMTPLPSRTEVEALASDVAHLWEAPTTSHKDRKRLLRALVADVTLHCEPGAATVRVGIRWRSGAAEEIAVRRRTAGEMKRTPPDIVELVRRMADRNDADIVTALADAGLVTKAGQPFDLDAIRHIRYKYHVLRTRTLQQRARQDATAHAPA